MSVLRAGSYAMESREPRQIRKEAAVSGTLRAPWVSLTRAASLRHVAGSDRTEVHGHLSASPQSSTGVVAPRHHAFW